MVELAIVGSVLILVLLGLLEFGFAWREVNVTERTTGSAARTAANVADGRFADYETIRVIDSGLGSLKGGSIERVIVYSPGPDGSVPAPCSAVTPSSGGAGVNGVCNVYGASQVSTSSFGGFSGVTSCAGGSWDRFWCPVDRDRDGQESIGVFIEIVYQPLTSLLPTDFSISRSAVFALEPCTAGDASC